MKTPLQILLEIHNLHYTCDTDIQFSEEVSKMLYSERHQLTQWQKEKNHCDRVSYWGRFAEWAKAHPEVKHDQNGIDWLSMGWDAKHGPTEEQWKAFLVAFPDYPTE